MPSKRLSVSVLLSGLIALFCALPAAAAPAAIGAFDSAFAKINDYTVMLHAHEVLGNQTQDRVYSYWFRKPHEAKTLIVSGDGSGGGGVWNGGNQVSGHQGGFLSHFHLKVDLHDHRAVSLRGYTIPDGLFQNLVAQYTQIGGALTEKGGPTIDGQATSEIDLRPAAPSEAGGATRMIMYLSKSTHMPLRQIRYAGDNVLTDESWTDLKTNVGLTQNDFPF
ncbi:MAG: hypothetical protein ABI182_07425 [Candidatus Baltobacteraceae bacterium]